MLDPTVWVIQDNNYQIRSADKFGSLRFITQYDLSNVSGSRSDLLISNDIREFLMEYQPMVDYILLIGNPIVIGMVFAGIRSRDKHKFKHNILKWDARDKKYYDYIVDLSFI